MDHSDFELNGQTFTISAEVRHLLSGRLPSIGLAKPRPSVDKRLFVCSDRHGRQRALTLFPVPDDLQATPGLAQATEVATLLDGRGFAGFVDAGIGHWGVERKPMAAWVEEWVRGLPLDTVLTGQHRDFSCTHLQRLLLDLAEGLNALRSIGAVHTALNSRNVIFFRPHPSSLNPTSYFRLVDLSQAQLLTGPSLSPDESASLVLDEDRAIVEILAQAHNTLIGGAGITPAQREWLWSIGEFLIQASADLDQGQSLEPKSLRDLAASRRGLAGRRVADAMTTLGDPFNFISAEHIASDELLYRIFADSCPWIDEVSRPNPSLLVGPRGCGKSTILRWLSIRTQLAGDRSHRRLDQLPVGAFYVSCTAEIQSRVARFDTLERALAAEDALIHYLNLVILREVLSTLELMHARDEPQWGIDESFCRAVLDFVCMELTSPTAPIAGVHSLAQAYDIAASHLSDAQDALRQESTPIPVRLTSATFLNDLSALLSRESRFFAEHRVTYCLDDYSVHRVPEPVQQVLNRVVFGLRSANYIFKISAESRGFHPFDRAGARIDLEREATETDFGEAFIALGPQGSPSRAAQFARDLLANRLAAAGWEGSPEELLGATSMSHAEFANDARAAARGERPRPLYAGLPCIADLCSGDMATLLLVYRRIFELGHVTRTSRQLVPAQTQNRAIRDTSRDMLQLVRSHQPYGQQMLNIAQEFCTLARYALEHGLVREHDELVPMKRTRIEVDGLSLPELELADSMESALVKELIRRAIFIDIGPGDSRHREKITTRLMMRRIYLPAFQLSLAKNGQFAWTEKQFLRFLQDPAGVRLIEQRKISRSEESDPAPELPFDIPDDAEVEP